ncbi:hypothetical protein [Streptomyces sp. NPDC058045]|uniref:hypothetical protein n=1 Tax=Streptomyces sp. NPDC058045 TaxID=3346311 RepID=UPI0036F01ACF
MTDGRTGRRVEVPEAGRALLRMRVCLPEPEDGGELAVAGLRVLLVADLLVRTLESGGRQVLYEVRADGDPAVVRRAVDTFGAHPPSGPVGVPGVTVCPAGLAGAEGVRVEVGGTGAEPGALDGADPLAARLALLGHGYRDPLRLTAAEVAEAGRTLVNWRRQVATWARQPSRPVPPEVTARAERALADDLDTPGLLAVLRQAGTGPELAPGARFETFALLDRWLGLELTREVGRD